MSRFFLPFFSVLAVACIVCGLTSTGALAASCAEAAARLASEKGGRVLSVKAKNGKCVGVILVTKPNKPPRRVSFSIRK